MTHTTRNAPMNMFQEFPDFHCLARPSVRLHPRAAGSLPADASKMGGSFLQPAGAKWPVDPETGEEYFPVIQLLNRDLPETRWENAVFPFQEGTDCFQLLWLPSTEEPVPRLKTRWLSTHDREHFAHQVPYSGESEMFPLECRLHPEEIIEYPHRWALSEYHQNILLANGCFLELAGQHGEADNPLGFYQNYLGSAPGTKLGGHPNWVQDPQWPMSDRGYVMEHLLTVASWEGDGGDHPRWKPVEDGDPATSDGPNDDAGLMLGDAGDVYVFVCRQGRGWEVKGVAQCSEAGWHAGRSRYFVCCSELSSHED